jgi:hypothetical protein
LLEKEVIEEKITTFMLAEVVEALDVWIRAEKVNEETGSFTIPRAGLIGNRNSEHRSTSVNDYDQSQDWKRAFKNLW